MLAFLGLGIPLKDTCYFRMKKTRNKHRCLIGEQNILHKSHTLPHSKNFLLNRFCRRKVKYKCMEHKTNYNLQVKSIEGTLTIIW
jgi:hypothetical protein